MTRTPSRSTPGGGSSGGAGGAGLGPAAAAGPLVTSPLSSLLLPASADRAQGTGERAAQAVGQLPALLPVLQTEPTEHAVPGVLQVSDASATPSTTDTARGTIIT